MREIKFRAYYQKVTDDSWIIEGEYTLKDLTNRMITFDQERIDWVEYTGLKDKNGVEIYEGDIVNSPKFTKPKEIIWEEGRYKIDGTLIVLCEIEISCFEMEVIGNIYESKELLNVL